MSITPDTAEVWASDVCGDIYIGCKCGTTECLSGPNQLWLADLIRWAENHNCPDQPL